MWPDSGAVSFVFKRPRRDGGWAAAWGISMLVCVLGGLAAFSYRDPRFQEYMMTDYLDVESNCPVGSAPAARRRLLGEEVFNLDKFSQSAGTYILLSAASALLVGLFFIHLVRVNARAMATFVIALQVAIPAGAGLLCMARGATVGGVLLLGMAALSALCFFLWRQQIAMVVRLLGVSGAGLQANPGIPLAVVAASVGTLLLALPLVLAMVAAYANGSVLPNPQRFQHSSSGPGSGLAAGSKGGKGGDGFHCLDLSGNAVMCCSFQPDAWVAPFISFAAAVLTWTVMLVFEVKVFTVSGAIAHWYFAAAPCSPSGASSSSAAAIGAPTAGGGSRTLLSLRHALGPSFGSLCLGSGVLALVSLVRSAMQRKQRPGGEGGAQRPTFGVADLVACLLRCVLACFLAAIEYITKFATIYMAITGEPFFQAGRSVCDLLTRNFLDAYSLWWLPGTILNSFSFILAAAWGIIAYLISAAAWAGQPSAGGSAAALGAIAFLFAYAVLAFFSTILLNIMDAVFICFAIDRDNHACTRRELHDVYMQLPSVVGGVVEQPDGGYSYAALPQTAGYQPGPGGVHAPLMMDSAAGEGGSGAFYGASAPPQLGQLQRGQVAPPYLPPPVGDYKRV